MVLLNIPKSSSPYVVVSSYIATKLHQKGFQPIFRELKEDKVYFIDSQSIREEIRKINFGG